MLRYRPAMHSLLSSPRARVRAALALMFLTAASARLAWPDTLVAMVPEGLPLRREAVYLSGFFEAAGAVGLLIPALRRPAGLGLALLLVAVFPANVNMAVQGLRLDGYPVAPVYLWARLPLQIPLIWLVLWASRDDHATRDGAATR